VNEYECVFPSSPGIESEEEMWRVRGYVVVEVVVPTTPKRFVITVRDPVRHQQDVASEFGSGRTMFYDINSVIVPEVNRAAILAAIDELARTDFDTLVPE
jgi:hypothetical protein